MIFFTVSAESQVIVHPSAEALEREQILSIIRGDNLGYSIYIESKYSESFISDLLGMSKYEYNKKWGILVFTGRAPAPNFLESKEAIIRAISHDETSIGIISDSDKLENVRVELEF
jgi:hypothetical protein